MHAHRHIASPCQLRKCVLSLSNVSSSFDAFQTGEAASNIFDGERVIGGVEQGGSSGEEILLRGLHESPLVGLLCLNESYGHCQENHTIAPPAQKPLHISLPHPTPNTQHPTPNTQQLTPYTLNATPSTSTPAPSP